MKFKEYLIEKMFGRNCVIRALKQYNTRIAGRAVKLIVFPDSEDVPMWRRRIRSAASYLACRGLSPMGFELAFQYLYEELFVGDELGMTSHFIKLAEFGEGIESHVDVAAVHTRLKEFLTNLAIDIGAGRDAGVIMDAYQKYGIEVGQKYVPADGSTNCLTVVDVKTYAAVDDVVVADEVMQIQRRIDAFKLAMVRYMLVQ